MGNEGSDSEGSLPCSSCHEKNPGILNTKERSNESTEEASSNGTADSESVGSVDAKACVTCKKISRVCEIFENQLFCSTRKKYDHVSKEDVSSSQTGSSSGGSWWPFAGQRGGPYLNREMFSDDRGQISYAVTLETLEKDFEVDMKRDVDSEGWEYATDFSSKFDKEVGPYAMVRRRCWVRKASLTTSNVDLLPGEHVLAYSSRVNACAMYSSRVGSLCLTNYRLCMVESFDNDNHSSESMGNYEEISSDPGAENKIIFQIPVNCVSQLQRRESFETDYSEEIFLSCKDFRALSLNFSKMSGERRLFYDRLKIAAFPLCFGEELFAYEYGKRFSDKLEMDGWKIYNAVTEYKRQGLESFPQWSITDVNYNYKFCESYPETFVVPSNLSNEQLIEIGQFRSNCRIPVATWIHPSTGCAILRSGQPLTGMRWQSSSADEALLIEIAESSASGKLLVLDARPKTNALFNQLMGGGYEDTSASDNIDLDFCGIGNIHVMRDSLNKMQNMIYQGIDDEHWLSNLEKSQWLHNLKAVLTAASRICHTVDRSHSSVLIHCSDGWDRSSQLSALAMMFLDPYYRTIIGFEVLIEKEWLSFGHKFHERLGHSNLNSFDREISPIFLQFIDCVWQTLEQFPHAFEFTEKFLITILDEMYSCRFGTFLYNNERERSKRSLKDNTVSLWSFIDGNIDSYVNVEYSVYVGALYPVSKISNLKFWSSYYLRFQNEYSASCL